jgi:hypothetical protein
MKGTLYEMRSTSWYLRRAEIDVLTHRVLDGSITKSMSPNRTSFYSNDPWPASQPSDGDIGTKTNNQYLDVARVSCWLTIAASAPDKADFGSPQ